MSDLHRHPPTASSSSPAQASAPRAACPPFARRTAYGPDTTWRKSVRPRLCGAIRRWSGSFIPSAAPTAKKPRPIPRTSLSPNSKRSSNRVQGAAIFSARRMSTTCTSAPEARIWSTCTASLRKPAASASAAGRPSKISAVYASLDAVGRCPCGGRLRPHIVFFGEIPLEMPRIEREIAESTLMLVIGTSGSVYPAANFVHWARQAGARTVYIGPEPPLNAAGLHAHRRRQSRRGSPRALPRRNAKSALLLTC